MIHLPSEVERLFEAFPQDLADGMGAAVWLVLALVAGLAL